MTTLRWTDQALEDLSSIRDFIARDVPGYAEIVVERIFESAERLVDFPLSGRVVPEFEQPEIRELILGVYRVVYRVREDRVDVLTVFHSARLLTSSHLFGA